jgi:hypothetical protein
MKANDLRIGNYIEKSLKSGQGRKLIDKVGCQDIVRMFENTGSFNYEPIKLTDKWLTDFGFTKSKTQDKFYNKDNNVGISTADDKFRFIQGNFVCQLVLTDLKYVHELQNIFY